MINPYISARDTLIQPSAHAFSANL